MKTAICLLFALSAGTSIVSAALIVSTDFSSDSDVDFDPPDVTFDSWTLDNFQSAPG